MGRKGLNCDAANATLHGQADWKREALFHPFSYATAILAAQSLPPPQPLAVALSDTLPFFRVLFLPTSAKLILPAAPPR